MAALIDTGSSINVISKTLFDSISYQCKISFHIDNSEVRLANNAVIPVLGTATLNLNIEHQGEHNIDVHILTTTSHPLILGTEYLAENNVVLDFKRLTCDFKNTSVQTTKRIKIEPNVETVVWCKVPQHITYGLQGVCTRNKYACSKGLLIAKSLITVSQNRKVPVKILNLTNDTIMIPKGRSIAEFSVLTNDYSCIPMSDDIPQIQHVELVTNVETGKLSEGETEGNKDFEKIRSMFKFPDNLDDIQSKELMTLLNTNMDLFVTEDNPNLGFTNLVEHKITLKQEAVGKHQKPYRLPPYKREILREQLDNLLKQGIIAPVSDTDDLQITSPIVLVTKRSNKTKDKLTSQDFRFVCDFRYLNSQTKDFKYAIPDLQELTESFSDITPNYISSIDLSSGFFQMGISPESTNYTAFNTCFGTFKFLRLPMGLKTSPNSFQLLMDKVLRGLKFKTCLCYLDDVLICSSTFAQHIIDLQEIFNRLKLAGLKLGPNKCTFAANEIVFLGHLISKDGIRPPPDRVKAIAEYPVPNNIKELRRLTGLFNWFRKYIPHFSTIISPLTKLLKKGQKFIWTKDQDEALNTLKYQLVHSEMLSFPRYDLPFRLGVDTSARGIGYMLYQLDPSDETQKPRIIRFGSKSLSPWQRSYGPTKLELLGMVVSILDCKDYLRGTDFVLECDHQALKPLYQKQFKGAIYERWMAILQQFNFTIEYKKAEDMQVADALSRCENTNAEIVESPVEDDPYFPFVSDNTGQITLPNKQNLVEMFNACNAIQPVTLNDDPYDADTDENVDTETRQKKKLVKTGSSNTILNDKILTNIGLGGKQVKQLQRKDRSLLPIISYLEDDDLPDSQKEARRILLESNDYAIIDGILYHSRVTKNKRNKMMDHYQIVIPESLIETVLKVVHDSPLGGHAGINNTLDRAKEQFFFPRMGKIISDYVQSCHLCQIRKVPNRKTKQDIVAFPHPEEPFQVWQIDLCGPFPVSVNGNSHVFTAVDLFSKFMFACPLRNKDALTVGEALFDMFTKYGVCQTLISDKGSEFVNKCTTEMCRLLEVTQEFTPAFSHHCLGSCERQHRTLAERLTTRVLQGKPWESELNAVLFSMNSSVNNSLQYSPFEIIYGKRPNFPLLNVLHDTTRKDIPQDVNTYFSEFTERLSVISDTVKQNAQYSGFKMQERENQKVNELKLSIGDYVYLQKTPTGQGRKLQALFDGPYIVNKILSDHLIKLRDPAGKRNFKDSVHINRLKIAHIRAPNPAHHLQITDSSDSDESMDSSDKQLVSSEKEKCEDVEVAKDTKTDIDQPLCRPRRNIRKPERYRDDKFTSGTDTNSAVDNTMRKVKRILAKRKEGSSYIYLTQYIGEPAQNARWMRLSELSS